MFQKTGNKCQIINLGCGFDTLYWRLKENNFNISNFIDVDFPTVTARKCHSIKRNNVLLQSLHNEGMLPWASMFRHSNVRDYKNCLFQMVKSVSAIQTCIHSTIILLE